MQCNKEAFDVGLCPGCFTEKGDTKFCTRCGYGEATERSSLLLPYGTVLRGQYVIGNVLGAPGGFGITYLGYNSKLEAKVAIKEFLPRDIAGRQADGLTVSVHSSQDTDGFRSGIQQFLNEARLLAKFSHPNIVRVLDFFEENGTAYLVMDYHQGINLVEYLKQQGGRLSESAVRAIMLPVLEGLGEVHARGVLHRDVKPQNIYITERERPILLDFGAARQATAGSSRSLSVMMTPGFAPYEQYLKQGKQGPWTDVYGAAATMYYLLTGEAPPDSLERMASDNFTLPETIAAGLSPEMKSVLLKGMALLPENRLQNIQELQALLGLQTVKIMKSEVAATQVLPAALQNQMMPRGPETSLSVKPQPSYKRPLAIALIVLFALLFCGGGGYWYYQHTHDPVNLLAQNGKPFTEEAFFASVKAGEQDNVKLFIKAGMSVNQVRSSTGETPIFTAIEANQPSIVSLLIAQGADLKYKDRQGRTPMDLALKQGNTQIVKQLMVELKLTPDSKDEKGKTLLENAIASGNIASVKYLIEQGADINSQDEQGNTLLDRMLAGGNQQMATVLKAAGAKRNINSKFKPGQLNEIKLPYGTNSSFEVDLLGDGMGQTVAINRYNFVTSQVSVSQENKTLTSFNIYGSNYYWYVAYLRDDKVPDLVYFYVAGSGAFVNDFKIIGRTGKDTVGLLYSADLGMLQYMGIGSGARLSYDGKRLILQSGFRRAAVEWNAEQQYFYLKPLV
jgi:serine/threonine protein kinase